MLASLCASAQSDTLLMRVGHLPVSRSEFLYAYRKNAGALPPSDFLRRFVRLKWRVCHAQTEGLDTTRLFRQQFENCKLRLQKLNRQQQASVSPEAPDTDGRWIARLPAHPPVGLLQWHQSMGGKARLGVGCHAVGRGTGKLD